MHISPELNNGEAISDECSAKANLLVVELGLGLRCKFDARSQFLKMIFSIKRTSRASPRGSGVVTS